VDRYQKLLVDLVRIENGEEVVIEYKVEKTPGEARGCQGVSPLTPLPGHDTLRRVGECAGEHYELGQTGTPLDGQEGSADAAGSLGSGAGALAVAGVCVDTLKRPNMSMSLSSLEGGHAGGDHDHDHELIHGLGHAAKLAKVAAEEAASLALQQQPVMPRPEPVNFLDDEEGVMDEDPPQEATPLDPDPLSADHNLSDLKAEDAFVPMDST
jgi:hypothetical protein